MYMDSTRYCQHMSTYLDVVYRISVLAGYSMWAHFVKRIRIKELYIFDISM